jgi:hypothetical protein
MIKKNNRQLHEMWELTIDSPKLNRI